MRKCKLNILSMCWRLDLRRFSVELFFLLGCATHKAFYIILFWSCFSKVLFQRENCVFISDEWSTLSTPDAHNWGVWTGCLQVAFRNFLYFNEWKFLCVGRKICPSFELCKFISCLTTLSLSLLSWKGCTCVYNMYVMEHLHPFVKDASIKIKYGSNIFQYQSFSGSSLSTFTQAL